MSLITTISLAWILTTLVLLVVLLRLRRSLQRVEAGLARFLERQLHSEDSYRKWVRYEVDESEHNLSRLRSQFERVLKHYRNFSEDYGPRVAQAYLQEVLRAYAAFYREFTDRHLMSGENLYRVDALTFFRRRAEELRRAAPDPAPQTAVASQKA